ncbi:phage head-tail connector protein [Xanthobacter aminoxidans]|uniref:phage head-tail connector protein n=1 Tax=Xanthobacter aminoxidans TaxID=186280 RepID=UPI002022DED2|nr:phage head-tail connector protein [Xanthobacter aminoxidans]
MALDIITTIVMPASTADLVTLDDVKTELEITGTAADAWLNKVISRASAAAAQYCNRTLVQEVVKDEFWAGRDGYPWVLPGGVAPLQLTRWPVTAVDSVLENGVVLSDPADYRRQPGTGHLIRLDGNSWPRKWPALPIVVQYTAGYSPIPDDLQDAVIRMVKARWFLRQRDPLLRQEETPGVYSATYWVSTGADGAITPDVSDLLDNYRVPVACA